MRPEKQEEMKIKKRVIEQIISHAKKDIPLEACGYLAAGAGIVTAAYELTNIDQSSEHFSFDPKEQFWVMRDARAKGLEICAVYHSHPASPARPSPEDIKLAFDARMFYVIVSLVEGKDEVRAFKIKGQQAYPESLEVIEDV